MKYELVENQYGGFVIKRTDAEGNTWWIPMAEGNSDYAQYLVDTDGGLPEPKPAKAVKPADPAA